MAKSPPTQTLLDVIVLCFAKSDLKSLVGTDALRSVLEGSKRALFPEPDVMALQPLYELLEGQPGFDAEKAVAPFCRLKGWESRLQIRVELPVNLQVLDPTTRDHFALRCNATDSDLDKLILPATQASAPLTRVLESRSMGNIDKAAAASKRAKIAMIAAAVGIVAAAISIFLTFRGGTTAMPLSGKDISDQMPLTDVRKSGQVILATISDPKWLEKPEIERRLQMETAAPKVRAQEASKLVVLDVKGNLVATLVVRKNGPVVTFSPSH